MSAVTLPLAPAAAAFDAIAEAFDDRFGGWASVAAQRAQVRCELLRAFPCGSSLLEIGGGTGLDASWLAWRGRTVHLTDASPAMVRVAAERLGPLPGCRASVCAAEELATLEPPSNHPAGPGDGRGAGYDGAFSNFAALNCVPRLDAFARGLAGLLRLGAPVLLVLFGGFAPGEVLVQLARGNARAAVRRLARGDVEARLGGREFTVRYHRRRDLERALRPWFRLERARGIGVFVPPSAAEPWITGHPRLLRALAAVDRVAAAPLARLGDHVLYWFVCTAVPMRPTPARERL